VSYIRRNFLMLSKLHEFFSEVGTVVWFGR